MSAIHAAADRAPRPRLVIALVGLCVTAGLLLLSASAESSAGKLVWSPSPQRRPPPRPHPGPEPRTLYDLSGSRHDASPTCAMDSAPSGARYRPPTPGPAPSRTRSATDRRVVAVPRGFSDRRRAAVAWYASRSTPPRRARGGRPPSRRGTQRPRPVARSTDLLSSQAAHSHRDRSTLQCAESRPAGRQAAAFARVRAPACRSPAHLLRTTSRRAGQERCCQRKRQSVAGGSTRGLLLCPTKRSSARATTGTSRGARLLCMEGVAQRVVRPAGLRRFRDGAELPWL
jgi:hypothetical protein